MQLFRVEWTFIVLKRLLPIYLIHFQHIKLVFYAYERLFMPFGRKLFVGIFLRRIFSID